MIGEVVEFVAVNERRNIVKEVKFHLCAHHQRGEHGGDKEQNVQPIPLFERLHDISFRRQILGLWSRNWGIEVRHEDFDARNAGEPAWSRLCGCSDDVRVNTFRVQDGVLNGPYKKAVQT